jgi:hypothetical protein
VSLFRSFHNQYSAALNTTSTGAAGAGSTGALSATVDFGFPAALLKLSVQSGGPAYLQLNGQTATTADYPLSTGDALVDWYDVGVGLSGLSFMSTSTGTVLRVGAWG